MFVLMISWTSTKLGLVSFVKKFIRLTNNHEMAFNSFPHNKISKQSKMKDSADNKINVTEKLKFDLERVEYIVGKGENAGYQRFLHFPQCFQKLSLSRSLDVGLCGKK